jgi:hypothetical protein
MAFAVYGLVLAQVQVKAATEGSPGDNEGRSKYSPRRGGRDCRYHSPDTDPDTDPDGTADGTAMGLPMGLRGDCDNSPDGTAIHKPKSGVGVVGRGVGRVELNCNCNAAASRRKPLQLQVEAA